MWEAAVKMPGHEKPLSFGMLVRQTAAELSHVNQWSMGGQILTATVKRRDESRRGRQECLRHDQQAQCQFLTLGQASASGPFNPWQ